MNKYPLIQNYSKSNITRSVVSNIVSSSNNTMKMIANSLAAYDKNMNMEAASRMLATSEATKQRNELLRQHYNSEEMSFEDYSSKLEICKMLHEQNPIFSIDYYMKNFESFMNQALGFDASPSTYWDGINKAFKAGASNIYNGVKVAGFLLDTLGTNQNSLEYTEKKDKLMDSLSTSMSNYRNDLAYEKYNGLIQKMGLATAMQAPQIAMTIGGSVLSGFAGASSKLARTLGSLPMSISMIGNAAETALDAGFDKDTTLALSLGVGLLNTSLEYIGDSPMMNSIMDRIKLSNINDVNELVIKSVGQLFATTGKDVIKSMGSEITTEVMQTAVEMLGYNFALNYEQMHKGKFEDLTGYSAKDFGKAFADTAIETALSTPLMALAPSVATNFAKMYGGEWGQAKSASTYTKYENGASTKQASSIINTYSSPKKGFVELKELKKKPIAPLSIIYIGNKSYLYNPSDEALSVHNATKKSSKNYVYAKEENFSVFKFYDPEIVKNEPVSNLNIALNDAYAILQKRFVKDQSQIVGFSLLDSEKKETKSEEKAKYIAVGVDGVDEPAVVTLGKGGSTVEFEKEVFGTVIETQQEKKTATPESTKSEEYIEDEEDEDPELEEDKVENVEEVIKEAKETKETLSELKQDELSSQEESQPTDEIKSEPNTEKTSEEDIPEQNSEEAEQKPSTKIKVNIAEATVKKEAKKIISRREKANKVATAKKQFENAFENISEQTGAIIAVPSIDEIAIEVQIKEEGKEEPVVKSEPVSVEKAEEPVVEKPVKTIVEKTEEKSEVKETTKPELPDEEKIKIEEQNKAQMAIIANNVKNEFKKLFKPMNRIMNLDDSEVDLFSEAATLVATAFSGIDGTNLFEFMNKVSHGYDFFNFLKEFSSDDEAPIATIGKLARLYINNADKGSNAYLEIAKVYTGLKPGSSKKSMETSMKNFEEDFIEYLISGNVKSRANRLQIIFEKLKSTVSALLAEFRLKGMKSLSERKMKLFDRILNEPESLAVKKLDETVKKASSKKTGSKTVEKQVVEIINSVSTLVNPETEATIDSNKSSDIKDDFQSSSSDDKKEESKKLPDNQKDTETKKKSSKKKAEEIVDAVEKKPELKLKETYIKDYESLQKLRERLDALPDSNQEKKNRLIKSINNMKKRVFDNFDLLSEKYNDIANTVPNPYVKIQKEEVVTSVPIVEETKTDTFEKNTETVEATEAKAEEKAEETKKNEAKEEIDNIPPATAEKLANVTSVEGESQTEDIIGYSVSDETYELLTGKDLKKGERVTIYSTSTRVLGETNTALNALHSWASRMISRNASENDVKNALQRALYKNYNLAIKAFKEFVDNGSTSIELFVEAAKRLTNTSKAYQMLTSRSESSLSELRDDVGFFKSTTDLLVGPYALENIIETAKEYVDNIPAEVLQTKAMNQFTFEFEVDAVETGKISINYDEVGKEYPDHVKTTNDGYLVFDRKKLAEDIVNSSNGAIGKKTAKLAAAMLCIMPKSTQDALIKVNGGRLVMSEAEAIMGMPRLGVRGMALLEQAKIILNPTSDLSSVLHETFHLMITYDTEARNNIYSSIRDAFTLKGKDYEELAKFVEKNIPIFVGRSQETVMEDFELITKESLTEKEEIRLEEAIASLYEAWLRNEKRDSGILGKIGQIFKMIAEKFKEIYKFATGNEFLPESVDIAFQSLFSEKDSKIYHYNGRDAVFRAQQSIQDNLNEQRLKATSESLQSNIIIEGHKNILGLYNSSFIKAMKNGIDDGIAYLESKGLFKNIKNASDDEQYAIKKTVAEDIYNVVNTPSYVAKKLNNYAIKIEENINADLYKIEVDETEGSDFMKLEKSRRNAIKKAFKDLNDMKKFVDDLFESVYKKVYDYQRFIDRTSENIASMGIVGNSFSNLASQHKRKDKPIITITPDMYVAFTRNFVDKDGNIILGEDDADGVEWSPLIDIMYIINSDQNKVSVTSKNNDKASDRYKNTSRSVLFSMQSTSTKVKSIIPPIIRQVADHLRDLGEEVDLVKFLESDHTDFLEQLLAEFADREKKYVQKLKKSTINGKQINTLKDISITIGKLIKKANERVELEEEILAEANDTINNLISKNTSILEQNRELKNQLNTMQKIVDSLKNKYSESALEELKKERDHYIKLLSEQMKKTESEINELTEKIEVLRNTQERPLIEIMLEERNKVLNRISAKDSSEGCEANAVAGIRRISKMMRTKSGNKNKIKFIPSDTFKGPSWNPELYVGLQAELINNGFIARAKDAGINIDEVEIPLKDGKPMYDENSWVVVKGLKDIGAEPDALQILNKIADEVDEIVKNGQEESLRLKNEREQRVAKYKKIIINSFKNIGKLKNYDAYEYAEWLEKAYHPGSNTQQDRDDMSLFQNVSKDFILMTQQIKKASPALYSYMFGGIVDEDVDGTTKSSYVNRNLNTAANMEAANKTNRLNKFNELIMNAFEIKDKEFLKKAFNIKGAKYSMHRLFSQEKIKLGNLSMSSFEGRVADLGKYDSKTKLSLISTDRAEFEALSKFKVDTEKSIRTLKNDIKKLNKEITLTELAGDEKLLKKLQKELADMKDDLEYKTSIMTGEGVSIESEYTMQQIMGIYILSQQYGGIKRMTERSTDTVMSNNIGFNNILWVMDQMVNNEEFKPYKTVADGIIADMNSRYEAIAEVYYRINDGQRILKKIDMYFPFISQQNQNTEFTGIAKDINFSLLGTVTNKKVDEGFTKERKPSGIALDLNVVDNYITAMGKQEHYIAFKEITDEMTEMFNSKEFKESIEYAYRGKKGEAQRFTSALHQYMDKIKNTSEAVESTSRLLTWIRSNFAVSKLWGNASTVLQQLPTFFLVASKIGFGKAWTGLFSYLNNRNSAEVEALIEKSPQIRERVRYDIAQYQSIDRSNSGIRKTMRKLGIKEGAFEKYDQFIDAGLAFMEKADNGVTKAMYYVMYNEMYAEKRKFDVYKTMSDEEYEVAIINEASQAILDMVPSQNVKDNALIYSSKDNFIKDILVFTSQLNKQFNMVYGDFYQEEFTMNTFKNALPDIAAVMAVSACACFIGGQMWPADDEEDKWISAITQLLWGTMAESISGVPYVGTYIRDLMTGNNYAESSIINEAFIFAKKLGNEDTSFESYMTSVVNMVAETLTFTGAPSTALQKVWRTVKAMEDDASFGDLGYLINTNTGNFFGD